MKTALSIIAIIFAIDIFLVRACIKKEKEIGEYGRNGKFKRTTKKGK